MLGQAVKIFPLSWFSNDLSFCASLQRKAVYRRLTVLILLRGFLPHVFSWPDELPVRNILVNKCKILDALGKTIWTWKGILYSLTNLSPKEYGLFSGLRNGKDSEFFQLGEKAQSEMDEIVQAQLCKHNLWVFHRYKWMRIYSVLAIRKNCVMISSWMLTCLLLLDTGKKKEAWWEFKGGSGTEENCLKRWLTALGAHIMESFFTNNFSQLLPRGQSFLKMYQYTNTQTHAHLQEHLFIRHNKLGSVLFYLTSHKEVSALIFFPPFRRSQVYATLKKNWALLNSSWNRNIHRYSYEFLSNSYNLGLLILHFLQH